MTPQMQTKTQNKNKHEMADFLQKIVARVDNKNNLLK